MKTHWLPGAGLLLLSFLFAACGAAGSAASDTAQDNRVNVGYGTADKDNVNYSVSTVKVSDKEIATYSNMYDYLRGRVPGVVVGPGNSITIRGINSINASTEPLILVDGVEVNDLSSINPLDVYSVDVLKDASSSIYGVRGGNGVILITTKGARHTDTDK